MLLYCSGGKITDQSKKIEPLTMNGSTFRNGQEDYFWAFSQASLLTKAVRLRPSAVLPRKA